MDNSEPRSQEKEPAELTAGKDQNAARSVAAVDNIPDSLRATPQWVCWRYVSRDGKRTKAPVNPHDGGFADSTSRATWGTFEQALEASRKDRSLAGIGFVFTADDPYCGVDVDDSIDESTGHLKPWAQQIVDRLDSYTEISPSGSGLKVFIKANKPGSRCRKAYEDGEVEIYDRDRFFTVTGNRLQSIPSEVNLRQESLDVVYSHVFGNDEPGTSVNPTGSRGPQPSDSGSVSLSDDEIIDLACKRRTTGMKFQALWNGDWNSYFNSASEADSSIVFTLAYFTKDAAQIDRIFRRSQLMRDKWDQKHGNESYGQRTIAKALSKVTKQYEPKKKRPAAPKQGSQPPANLGFPKAAIDWDFKSDQTENAMAVEFIDGNQAKLRYVPSWKKWLAWDGKRWKVDVDTSRTTRLARRLVRNYWDRLQHVQSEKQQKEWADFCRWANRKTTIENVVSLARCDARTTIDHELLNQNTYFLNLQNGTLNLSTWDFRDHRQTDSITQNATSEGSETSRFLRAFLCQKVTKLLNSTIQKNPQKHWDYANCARLRWVISLSSICVRAWELTKVTGAIWRTGLNSDSSNESSRTAACNRASNVGCRFGASRHQPAFESRNTLRTDARSLPSRPARRISHSSRKWANGGPHDASATMARASPKRWVLPQKPTRSWAAGTAASIGRVSLSELSGRLIGVHVITQERKREMRACTGMNELTAEQRLAEIASCLAQGIVDLHKQGRLGTSAEEFSPDSSASLDFGLDSGLSVNSVSISVFSNNYEGATNVIECD